MDLKAIVNKAFQETYKPLTDWQQFVIEQAVDFVAKIDREDGFACTLGGHYGSPISYFEHEFDGERRNTASVEMNVAYLNQMTTLSIEFTEIFVNGTRRAKCSAGNGFFTTNKRDIDLSHPDAMNRLLEEVAKTCGEKMAQANMAQQLSDAIAAQRLLLTQRPK